MKAAFGRLHKGGLAAFGGQPTFVERIMGDQMCIKYVRVCIFSGGLVNLPAPRGEGGSINPGEGGY